MPWRSLLLFMLTCLVAPEGHAAEPAEAERRPPLSPAPVTATSAPVSASPAGSVVLETLGPPWVPQGPGPILQGSNVENVVPDNEAVGGIQAVVPHPSDPNTLFAGAVNGGIWRTYDALAARPGWQPIGDDLGSLSIGALALDPADPDTLLAGLGRFSNFAQRGAGLTGLLLSHDGGSTWTELADPLLIDENFAAVAIRANLILAASNGFWGTGALFRSTDGGASFAQISGLAGSGLPSGDLFDLVGDPTQLLRFYVAVEDTGIFRSQDGGATWLDASSGDATLDGVITTATHDNTRLTVGPAGRVFAGVTLAESLAYAGFSDDLGVTWTALDLPRTLEDGAVEGLHPGLQGDINFSIEADPLDPNAVYVGGDRQPQGNSFPNFLGANSFSGRLFRGDVSVAPTGGVPSPQWEHLTHSAGVAALPGGGTASSSAPHPDSRDMAVDAGGDLLQVDDGGIYARTSPLDNSGDWLSVNGTIAVAELHDVAYDSLANVLIAGAQDNATPQQRMLGDPTWDRVGSGDGGDVAVDDTSTPSLSIRYSSNQYLRSFRRRSYDASNTLISQVFPALTVVGGGAPLVGQFKTPVELNAVDPTRLVIGASNSVYESLNRGDSIREIAPGVRANRPGALAYGGRKGGSDNEEVLYVGSDSDVLLRSVVAGPLVATAYPGGFVRDIALDPLDWHKAYVVDSNQVFATADAGATWTEITDNLGVALGSTLVEDFRTIEFVRTAAGETGLVVGGRRGVFVRLSTTPGWVGFGADLPHALVFELEYDPADDLLAVATLGRGAWILPGAGALVGALALDSDGDGLSDLEEAGLGTDPQLADTDMDGLTDLMEVLAPPLDPLLSDTDADGTKDGADSCPTVAGSQLDGDGDGVGDVCDTCLLVFNPALTPAQRQPWMTLVSGQRDDDGDGSGNRCDFKYAGNGGQLVGPIDVADMRRAVFEPVSGATCGQTGAKGCGQFDHDEAGSLIAPSDVASLRARVATPNGPDCGAACAPPFGSVGRAICTGSAC